MADEFAYHESMGPKECLAFFQAHLLPSHLKRYIVLKMPNTNPVKCKAFFRVIMRYVDDKARKDKGRSPLLSDNELEEITKILSAENNNSNDV